MKKKPRFFRDMAFSLVAWAVISTALGAAVDKPYTQEQTYFGFLIAALLSLSLSLDKYFRED